MSAASPAPRPAASLEEPARPAAAPSRLRRDIALLFLFAAAVAALAALMLFLRRPGDAQVNFVSREAPLAGPGGRVIFYPERGAVVVKGWFLAPLPSDRTYAAWAHAPGGPRSLGTAEASTFREIALFLRADLSDVERVTITVEPVAGSALPTGAAIVEMKRQSSR